MKRLFVIALLALGAAGAAHAEIGVNGFLRNDAAFTFSSNQAVFNDVLENRVLLSRKTDNWKFYLDLRMKLYYGQAASQISQAETGIASTLALLYPALTNSSAALLLSGGGIVFSLPRAFVKIYTPAGDVTVGKTYVNFGIPGIFNPFELDKTVNFSDLSYDKNGILAVDYDYPLGNLAGGQLYVSPQDPLSNTAAGGSLYWHLGTFDAGLAANRTGYDRTLAGAYFKGDLGIGVHGGYAYHFDDHFTNNFNEANLGADYSFFGGKLITSLDFYWADNGAESTNDYNLNSGADKYFTAKYYLYGNVTADFDEFTAATLDAFVNLVDGSGIVMPGLSITAFDGLFVTLRLAYVWSEDENTEFSSKRYGSLGALVRVEAKL